MDSPTLLSRTRSALRRAKHTFEAVDCLARTRRDCGGSSIGQSKAIENELWRERRQTDLSWLCGDGQLELGHQSESGGPTTGSSRRAWIVLKLRRGLGLAHGRSDAAARAVYHSMRLSSLRRIHERACAIVNIFGKIIISDRVRERSFVFDGDLAQARPEKIRLFCNRERTAETQQCLSLSCFRGVLPTVERARPGCPAALPLNHSLIPELIASLTASVAGSPSRTRLHIDIHSLCN